MGFTVDVSVPALTVFFQGLLSFFSPCVLPLIPLYIGYLSGGAKDLGGNQNPVYNRGKVLLHTVCFVVGVSFAFFLLGLGVSALGTFFQTNQLLFARIGGILVAMFGLYQLGLFGTSEVLGKERRLPLHLERLAVSPLTALVMGFTFSFAWTPCVGPAMASVLLMAASAGTKIAGFVLIGVYTLGFVLPFLAVGFFTTSLLSFFKTHMGVVRYTVKIGGILMVLMGIFMFTGKMNDVTGYLSKISAPSGTERQTEPAEPRPSSSQAAKPEAESVPTEAQEEAQALPPAMDFTLTDQYGNTHTLSDYKGKTVFLNFWATWCPPCRAEMPDIQKLYETYDTEGEDALIVLGIAAPNIGQEQSEEGITEFLEKNGYTYPVVMDRTGDIFAQYGITSFPTTFMIDRDGNLFGYVSGQLSEDMMKSIIEQTMEGKIR